MPTGLNPCYEQKTMSTLINIGKYSYLNDPWYTGRYDSVCLLNGDVPAIDIGRYTSIGKNCQFILTHHNYKTVSTYPSFGKVFCRGNIKIGNDVWIGMNATIMDNVVIGDGAVIGASSVVSSDVPPYAIAVGNPAKVIKYRFPPETIAKLMQVHWWDLEEDELLKLGISENKDIDAFVEKVRDYKMSKAQSD